ncbi:MAG: hypothetical protein KKD74_00460 [Bacteroidetes bacterium]|nr:hypothetical protein [Bacteroidales bacterium]MBU1008580.1 hypothetical protein [Bacteroidota bacterium]
MSSLFSKPAASNFLKIDVSFKYHRKESGVLIVYNNGKIKLAALNVRLSNDKKEVFSYKIDSLMFRTAHPIEYLKEMDLNGRRFEGELTRVDVETSGVRFSFTLNEENKFTGI